MKKYLLLCSLVAFGAVMAVPMTSMAKRGDDEELDESASPSTRQGPKAREIREVYHGAYVKATYGTLGWLTSLGTDSGFGTAAGFEFGYDVVDRLGLTLSITATFYQGINNGVPIDEGGSGLTQGDFRSIGGLVGARIGFNPGRRKVRRWTIAVDIKGGIYVSPALRPPGSFESGMLQAGPGGLILPGFGIEHFTRLSHFSLGVDAHVPMVVGTGLGFALGLDVTPFFKYTF